MCQVQQACLVIAYNAFYLHREHSFINDLAEEIKASNVGLDLDPETCINILLYADDIVLLAKTEADLQFLLFLVENWC